MKFLLLLSYFAMVWGLQIKPIKGYILAGQSNMQGHAKVSVLDYMKEDLWL